MGKRLELRGETSGLHPLQSPVVLSNLSVAHMSINNCAIPLAPNPKQRATLRDISIFECEHYANSISHVTLRGGMGGLRSSPFASAFHQPHLNKPYLAANAEEYRSIDWALDITEAEFGHFFSLEGIPASLIRRDPAHHFVMTRAAAQVVVQEEGRTVWTLCAQDVLDLGLPDVVLVAAGSPKLLRGYLDDAARLRDRGLLV